MTLCIFHTESRERRTPQSGRTGLTAETFSGVDTCARCVTRLSLSTLMGRDMRIWNSFNKSTLMNKNKGMFIQISLKHGHKHLQWFHDQDLSIYEDKTLTHLIYILTVCAVPYHALRTGATAVSWEIKRLHAAHALKAGVGLTAWTRLMKSFKPETLYQRKLIRINKLKQCNIMWILHTQKNLKPSVWLYL